MQETPVSPKQIGLNNRSANRDYYEGNYYCRDFKQWALTATMHEQDEFAKNNELYFKRRFGFDAPLEQRRDTIAVKNLLDFTDGEIRDLKKAGVLIVCKGKPTYIYAGRWVLGIGIFYMVLILLYLLPLALLIAFSHSPAMRIAMGLGVFCATILGMMWLSSMVSFHPLNLLRQRGIKVGQKWMLCDYLKIELDHR